MMNQKGVTLVELIVVVAIVGILALVGVPEINRFAADYKVRSCATDLIQNMRLARAMAIKENREYLITFDTANQRYLIGFSSNDNDLLDANLDTFGLCKDTNNDRLPDTDSDADGDGVPDCIRVVNLSGCGSDIQFNTPAPIGPDTDNDGSGNPLCANGLGVCFGATSNPIRADFNPNGSVGNLGSAYFQHATRGYSYVVVISYNSGAVNMLKWDGDADNTGITTWIELR